MPEFSQTRKFEQRFGKIKSTKQAQELIDLARESLQERREEFLKAMSEIIKKKRKGTTTRFFIKDSRGKDIATVKLSVDLARREIEIEEISTGEIEKQFKKNDSLRRLGIGTLMLTRIKQYAKKINCNKIYLWCHEDRIPFYEKNDFKDLGPIDIRSFWHVMEYIIHQ